MRGDVVRLIAEVQDRLLEDREDRLAVRLGEEAITVALRAHRDGASLEEAVAAAVRFLEEAEPEAYRRPDRIPSGPREGSPS